MSESESKSVCVCETKRMYTSATVVGVVVIDVLYKKKKKVCKKRFIQFTFHNIEGCADFD